MSQVREDLDNRLIRWYLDEVDVAELTLGYICDLTIKELRDGRELLFLHTFKITLLKELNEQKVRPEAAYFERLCWIRDVGHMEHEFDQKLFLFGISRFEVWVLNLAAQVPQFDKVLSHVCIKHS